MTRINVVPVEKLSRLHLIAEYRELPRMYEFVASAVRRMKTQATMPIPDEYVLATGHMWFFADKMLYIWNRHKELIAEMLRRGYGPNFSAPTLEYLKKCIPDDTLFNDYTPSEEAIAKNWKRLKERDYYAE